MNEKDRVLSVEKAIDLLNCYSIDKKELSIQDFVSLSGHKRTTVYRLLNSLILKGIISQKTATGTYQLGLPLLHYSSIVSESLNLREAAWETLQELSTQTQETINLNIIENDRRVCIEKIDSVNMIREKVSIGQSYHLLKGANGKVLLAFSPKEYMDHLINQLKKEEDKQKIINELLLIRQKGFAFSKNEPIEGAFALSAPIFTHENKLAGSISISGLSSTLNQEKKAYYISCILTATKKVSGKLGHIH